MAHQTVKIASVPLKSLLHRSLHLSYSSLKAEILDGRASAKQIQANLKQDLDKWMSTGRRRPHLTAVLVGDGDDPASCIYVQNKMIAAKEVGIDSRTVTLPASVTEKQLQERISDLNSNPNVDGILVQLPLPEHITERAICNAVVPHKDVDGSKLKTKRTSHNKV